MNLGRLAARECLRRRRASCHRLPLASFCTDGDGGQSPRVRVFDRDLKRKQRDRAAWLTKGKDQFVDSVTENLLDRLEVVAGRRIIQDLK